MEGISKETLVSLIYTDDYANDLINAEEALSLCKELPAQQWQTIDEFKANPVDGWCWINLSGLVDMAFYLAGIFYLNDTSAQDIHAEIWDIGRITHVMPIKTPEAPK